MNKLLTVIKRNTALKIFAFILAILLWSYVQIVQNPEISYEILEIPITISGEAAINSEGFVISTLPKNMKTNITISTKRSKINSLKDNSIEASLDVSQVSQSGMQSFSIKVKSNDEEIAVLNKRPSEINLEIDKLVTQKLPIKILYNGSLDQNYYIDKDNVIISPELATIKTPEKTLDKISEVLVSIDMTDVKKSFKNDYIGEVVDQKGELISNNFTTVLTKDIEVSVPILKKKTLPIKITNLPENREYTISQTQVEIAGSDEALNKISEIEAVIDNFYENSQKGTYTINLELNDVIQIDKKEITINITN